MLKVRFRRLGVALAVVCMILTMATTIWAFDGTKNISVIYRNIGIIVNGVEAKSTQGEPFIYEGRTYVPLRAVAEALGTDVSWDGQGNKVHINGNVDLSGKVYHKSATVIAQPSSVSGWFDYAYSILLVNAMDQDLNSVSLSCKAVASNGQILNLTARIISGGLKAHETKALQWIGGNAKMALPGDLSAVCELATPQG